MLEKQGPIKWDGLDSVLTLFIGVMFSAAENDKLITIRRFTFKAFGIIISALS